MFMQLQAFWRLQMHMEHTFLEIFCSKQFSFKDNDQSYITYDGLVLSSCLFCSQKLLKSKQQNTAIAESLVTRNSSANAGFSAIFQYATAGFYCTYRVRSIYDNVNVCMFPKKIKTSQKAPQCLLGEDFNRFS